MFVPCRRSALPGSAPRAALCLLVVAALALGACEGDPVDASDDTASNGTGSNGTGSNGTGSDSTGSDGAEGTDGAGGGGTAGGGDDTIAPLPDADGFALELPGGPQPLVEGAEALAVRVGLARGAAHRGAVTLVAEPADGVDAEDLLWRFDVAEIGVGDERATLEVTMPIGALPRERGPRALRIVASDERGASVSARLELELEPTSRPDVYLLAGQSNMVGSSGSGAREAAPGEPDARDPRVWQLNVTGNDSPFFKTPADFTERASIAPMDPVIVPALDPLHDGFDVNADGKEGTMIGLGLSFAKRALERTTADIVLVPAAWSDTGFCSRESNRLEGLGWLAEPRASPAFAGTLLHDRAIARTGLALAETGGILRGILWHQGEADVEDPECALAYEENLVAMVASLRSAIAVDARGESARGPEAKIPFVLGTMSRAGVLAMPSESEAIVDSVHRRIADLVPHAATVDADDLVPPAWPCGQGSCIHFGAAALRELGARYHDRLRETVDRD